MRIRFYALWALVQHPVLGNILFDTGYSARFFSATRYLPNRIYRWITPVSYKVGEDCLSQVNKAGIKAEHIRHVVISHFHADHIAGLKDFPESTLWCLRSGLEFALGRNRFNAVFKGILKSLIPKDISERACFPEEQFEESNFSGLKAWKWSNDLYFINLPGHSRGQIGLLVRNSDRGDLLFCADAAWSLKTIRRKIVPRGIVSLVIDNYAQLSQTIHDLNAFQQTEKQVTIIPSHCTESMKLINN